MRRCGDVKYEDVKIRRSEDAKMERCEDVNVKMYSRPPLLEDPFAQTLLGKKKCPQKGMVG